MSATDHRQPRARATYFTFPERLYLFPGKVLLPPEEEPGYFLEPKLLPWP